MDKVNGGKMSFIYGLFLSAISGLLLGAAYPPVGYSQVIWIALAPLFIALMKFAPSDGAFGFYCFTSVALWLFGMVRKAPGGYEMLYALPVLCGVAAFLVTFKLRDILTRDNYRWFTAIGSVGFVAVEYVRSFLPTAQFALLGTSQVGKPEYVQLASLFGVEGISFLIVVFNCTLALMLANLRSFGNVKNHVTLNIMILVALLGLNLYLLKVPIPEKGKVRAASVQIGFLPEEKEHPGEVGRSAELEKKKDFVGATNVMLDVLSGMTEKAAAEKAKIVVWPETILSVDPVKYPDIKKRISDLAVKTGVYIVAPFNQVTKGEEKMKNPSSLNGSYIVSPEGEYIHRYIKQIRVTSLGIEKGPVGHVSEPAKTSLGKLALMICYDTDYQRVPNEFVKNGAELFVVPSHDLAGFLTKHHPYLVSFRTVELRRSMVKADVVQGALIMDPWGRILADPPDGLQLAIADVPLMDVKTPSPWLSKIFGVGSVVLLFVFLFLARKKKV